jgi:hypothetical protein
MADWSVVASTGALPRLVGTTKYLSLNAPKSRELDRRDDLFSWFYSLIETRDNHFPWSRIRDRQRAYTAKCAAEILTEMAGIPRSMINVD